MRSPPRAVVLAALAAAGLFLAARTRLAEEAFYYVEDLAEAFDPVELDPMNEAANVNAFLALIRQAESANNYRALVGGGEFYDFTDHPAITGEFAGIPTADGTNYTTAAGAYQIVRRTWRELGGAARFGDFSPEAQDAAAIVILKEKRPGAWRMITQGRFLEAVTRLRHEWEAFDRMLAGNYPAMPLERAQAFYLAQGGGLIA